MNPKKGKLTAFEILLEKQDGRITNELAPDHRQTVLNFFENVYPFSELDEKIFQAGIWPKLTAVTY